MKLWIVYCALKDVQLKNREDRFGLSFDWCISQLVENNFRVISSPGKNHLEQKCFLLFYQGYPVLVPYRVRKRTIQLITFFPDRRFKYED